MGFFDKTDNLSGSNVIKKVFSLDLRWSFLHYGSAQN